jgi:hypothetical protein
VRLVVATLITLVGSVAVAQSPKPGACLLRGERVSLPIEVRPDDGAPFDISMFSDVAVHYDATGGPYPVDVERPLAFHGFTYGVGAVRLAREVKAANDVITFRRGAPIELLAASDGVASIEFHDSSRLSVRAETSCDALTLTAQAPSALSTPNQDDKAKLRWPKHAVLHIAVAPGRASAVAIDIFQARSVPLTLKQQSGEFALVKGDLGDLVIEGWVPVRELASTDELRGDFVTSEFVRNTPTSCHTWTPPDLHYARVPAGTEIYPAPGRHPWAKAATELRVLVPNTKDAWVQPGDWDPRVWISRSALIDDVPTRDEGRTKKPVR